MKKVKVSNINDVKCPHCGIRHRYTPQFCMDLVHSCYKTGNNVLASCTCGEEFILIDLKDYKDGNNNK